MEQLHITQIMLLADRTIPDMVGSFPYDKVIGQYIFQIGSHLYIPQGQNFETFTYSHIHEQYQVPDGDRMLHLIDNEIKAWNLHFALQQQFSAQRTIFAAVLQDEDQRTFYGVLNVANPVQRVTTPLPQHVLDL